MAKKAPPKGDLAGLPLGDAPVAKKPDAPKTEAITEGPRQKGGRNAGPSQVKERPAPPAPVKPASAGTSRAVTTSVRRPVTAAPQMPEGARFLAMIADAASRPDFNPENMRALLDMQKEIMAEQQRRDFNTAFTALQRELPTIRQDGRIVVREKTAGGQRDGRVQQSTPYATFNNIMKVVKPILARHGFSLWFATDPTSDGARLLVKGFLDHDNGGQRSSSFPLPAETSGSKNNVQGWGSSLSYGKRYCTIALLNIVSEAPEDRDTDGNDNPNLKRGQHGEFVEVDEVALISSAQEIELRDTIEWAGVQPYRVFDHYGIKKLAELPASMFEAAKKHLRDYKANQEAKKRHG